MRRSPYSELKLKVTSNMLPSRRGVPDSSVPDNPVITNLNSLLHDIYIRKIAFNDEDFEWYYNVVQEIFLQIHESMKRVDHYYRKYSSTVQYAGSHPDRLRIKKPDEFDIDIVIGLPLCIQEDPDNPEESDFIIEPQDPGFVQLRMGVQYDRIPKRFEKEWAENYAVYGWKDDENYLLGFKFMAWFKGVVNKALNKFADDTLPTFEVDGVEYTVTKSESILSPAMTLYIENQSRDFKLDVDLVPALRFPVDRWPIFPGYKEIPDRWQSKTTRHRYYPPQPGVAQTAAASQQKKKWHLPAKKIAEIPDRWQSKTTRHRYYPPQPGVAQTAAASQQKKKWHLPAKKIASDYFLVVPKANKSRDSELDRQRSWRLAMHEQERLLMHDTRNMRQAIRLIKKFRDAQKMDKISSYYIKTMFFWEAMERQKQKEHNFWNQSPAVLFQHMLEKFHKYLVDKSLPYFWNEENDLFAAIDEPTLKWYERTVRKLLDILEQPSVVLKSVAKYLLTEEEFEEYEKYLP